MINAIKYMDDLVETGFTQEQAKTTVSMWMELMNENLATKNEFKTLEHSIEKLDLKMTKEFELLRNEMNQKFISAKFTIISTLGSIIIGGFAILGFILKH